jgi:cyclopropane-fatty-acyl-phospholipid synthase
MSRVERESATLTRTAPRLLGTLSRRVLFAALAGLEGGALEVRAPDGVWRFGDPACAPQVLEVHDPRFFARLARSGKLAVGEGYQAGEWSTPDLPGLVALLARNHDQVFGRLPLSLLAAVARAVPRVELPRGLRRAERDVHAHYDLGNAFFSLWLDESMTYSCALFETPEATLAEAQQAKYRVLADATRIGPDDHVLEIGTGWGGFALHLARERGCLVTTTTISREQHGFATRRVAEAGLSDRIDVVYSDYRKLRGSYSRIVSIEMIEAIGHRQLGTYFATIDRLLARDGFAGIQSILVPDQRYTLYRRQRDWIRKHIFPGGMLPSLEAVTTAARRSSSLMVHDVQEIGPHYARTLREWRERFLLRRSEVEALGLDLHFQRTWEYYLAFCEAAFATHALRDAQLVLTRPLNRALAAPLSTNGV